MSSITGPTGLSLYTDSQPRTGAVAEVDPQATAYSRREVAHELNVNAVWLPNESIGEDEAAWAKSSVAALEPNRAGAHLNFLDADDQGRVPEAFSPAAYQRLVEVQGRFDPEQAFRRRLASVVQPA